MYHFFLVIKVGTKVSYFFISMEKILLSQKKHKKGLSEYFLRYFFFPALSEEKKNTPIIQSKFEGCFQ